MRIQKIIKEQNKINEEYDVVINGVTSKFWESLLENHNLPLSESAIENNNKALETMLYQTSMHLPDNQRERFFEELLNPSDEVMTEALSDVVAKTQDKIDAGKKWLVGKVGAAVKHVWEKYIPDSVKKMGTEIIEKVKKAVGAIIGTAGKFLGKIGDKLMELGRNDPCAKANESYELKSFEEILTEANQYFTADKATILANNIESIKSYSPDAPKQAAKAVAVAKQSGDVYGADLKGIMIDTYKAIGNPEWKSVAKGVDPYSSMAKWFTDNNMKAEIAKAEGKELGGAECTIEPGFIDKFFGTDSEIGKAWGKLGLDKDKALGGIVTELSSNKTGLLITIGSLILSFATGAGALRIVGLVCSSVIPLLITARIEDLKKKEAPAEQIEFWEKARSISKFVNTVIQLFNIGSLIANGWSAMTDADPEAISGADPDNMTEIMSEQFAKNMEDIGSNIDAISGFDQEVKDALKASLSEALGGDSHAAYAIEMKLFDDDMAAMLRMQQAGNIAEYLDLIDNPNGAIDMSEFNFGEWSTITPSQIEEFGIEPGNYDNANDLLRFAGKGIPDDMWVGSGYTLKILQDAGVDFNDPVQKFQLINGHLILDGDHYGHLGTMFRSDFTDGSNILFTDKSGVVVDTMSTKDFISKYDASVESVTPDKFDGVQTGMDLDSDGDGIADMTAKEASDANAAASAATKEAEFIQADDDTIQWANEAFAKNGLTVPEGFDISKMDDDALENLYIMANEKNGQTMLDFLSKADPKLISADEVKALDSLFDVKDIGKFRIENMMDDISDTNKFLDTIGGSDTALSNFKVHFNTMGMGEDPVEIFNNLEKIGVDMDKPIQLNQGTIFQDGKNFGHWGTEMKKASEELASVASDGEYSENAVKKFEDLIQRKAIDINQYNELPLEDQQKIMTMLDDGKMTNSEYDEIKKIMSDTGEEVEVEGDAEKNSLDKEAPTVSTPNDGITNALVDSDLSQVDKDVIAQFETKYPGKIDADVLMAKSDSLEGIGEMDPEAADKMMNAFAIDPTKFDTYLGDIDVVKELNSDQVSFAWKFINDFELASGSVPSIDEFYNGLEKAGLPLDRPNVDTTTFEPNW